MWRLSPAHMARAGLGGSLWLGSEVPGPRESQPHSPEPPVEVRAPGLGPLVCELRQTRTIQNTSRLVALNRNASGRVPGNRGMVPLGGHPTGLLSIFVLHGSSPVSGVWVVHYLHMRLAAQVDHGQAVLQTTLVSPWWAWATARCQLCSHHIPAVSRVPASTLLKK